MWRWRGGWGRPRGAWLFLLLSEWEDGENISQASLSWELGAGSRELTPVFLGLHATRLMVT